MISRAILQFLQITPREAVLLFWAALGLLCLLAMFPLDALTFQYQEL